MPSISATFEVLSRMRAEHRPNTGEYQLEPEALRAKILEDINYLQSRIALINRSKIAVSNPIILETYESLLEGKKSTLVWLEEYFDSEDTYIAGQAG